MKKQIFIAIFLAALAVLLAGTALVTGVMYNYYEQQYIGALHDQALILKDGCDAYDNYLENFGTNEIRVTLIDADGTVLFDNSADITEMENHADREEFKEAILHGEGSGTRTSDTLLVKTAYCAVRLDSGDVLRVAKDQYTLGMFLMGTIRPLVVVLIAAAALSLVLAAGVSKKIVKPINEIDLDNVEDAVAYRELTPFLRKIAQQRDKITDSADELRKKQGELLTITENMSEGLLIISSDTTVLSCNSAARRLFGSTNSGSGESVLAWNRAEGFRHAVEGCLAGKRTEQTYERDGRVCRIIASPVSHGGEIDGGVLLAMDITESEQRERLRREFTANVSHELKTPLTSISGYAEIIENGIAKPKDVKRFAGKIFDEAGRLIALVGDIIKLSQLDENAPAGLEQVKLLEQARSAAEAVGEQAERAKVAIGVSGSEVTINSVPQLVRDIVCNLCDNAVKFNKPGGSVKILVEKTPEGGAVTVSDTGVGIPISEQERVFERFYRVDKSRSKEIGGTGLGLSIVKHAAAYLGAEISMQSEPGRGTSIRVEFKENTARP